MLHLMFDLVKLFFEYLKKRKEKPPVIMSAYDGNPTRLLHQFYEPVTNIDPSKIRIVRESEPITKIDTSKIRIIS